MHTIDIALDTIDNDALTPRSAQAPPAVDPAGGSQNDTS
jgi:hypothetical protein